MSAAFLLRLFSAVAWLVGGVAPGGYSLYDDFTYRDTTFDRAKWWRGGLAGVDGTNAILNESDLTSSKMFLGGDFKFVIGGPSASSQGLFGLGDIDDGDPFLVLSNTGAGWRFHVRNGDKIHSGPIIAPALSRGDAIVFHWNQNGSSVSINGIEKDSQTAVRPPHMPLTMLEWNNSSTNGQIIMDSVSYSATTAPKEQTWTATPRAPAGGMLLSAALVEDTFVDSSKPDTSFNGSKDQIHIRNCRYHPDLTGAGGIVDCGRLALVQFALPKLPAGWKVSGARLTGTVAQNHNLYGMPGWAPARPIEVELLGLDVNPDVSKITFNGMTDGKGRGVIAAYSGWGSANFTFGDQAQSLCVVQFNTAKTPVGSPLQFQDEKGALCAFVRRKISQAESTVITLAIGPGRTQGVSGMECDFKFHARGNDSGQAPMSLALEFERGAP